MFTISYRLNNGHDICHGFFALLLPLTVENNKQALGPSSATVRPEDSILNSA